MDRSRSSTSALARSTLGILAAALLFELGLRPFVAGWNQPEGPVRTVRSLDPFGRQELADALPFLPQARESSGRFQAVERRCDDPAAADVQRVQKAIHHL